MPDLIIKPDCAAWGGTAENPPAGELFGHPLRDWRTKTRAELGLDTERPIIATGHQTMLWHPGILAKYLLVESVASAHRWAKANLIVDQHAGGYGEFDVPIRRGDGSLSVRRLELVRAPKDVPMALHEPFTPPKPPKHLAAALPSVERGVERIHESVYRHRDAPNAALQMGRALADLMADWVDPIPNVTATELIETSLSRAMIEAMANDPHRCAEAYNRAVRSLPEAGIGPLLVRDDYVELPLWRVRDDGRRMHAYDNDVQDQLDDPVDGPRLMPRALLMTALMRLGMCDLFVHGTGGANYDRAMERWIADWLGVTPGAIAVASADVYLPLCDPDEPATCSRRSSVHLMDRRSVARPITRCTGNSRHCAASMSGGSSTPSDALRWRSGSATMPRSPIAATGPSRCIRAI
jgi:hypothetical protein